jgi:hypothetical protein
MKVALNPDELFNLNPIIDEEYVIDIVAQHNAMTDNNELYRLDGLNGKRFDNPVFFAGYGFYEFMDTNRNLFPNISDYQISVSAKSPNNVNPGDKDLIWWYVEGCLIDVYKTPNNEQQNYILIIRNLRGVRESVFYFKVIPF